MDIKLKQRILGAIVLLALAIIFVPMIFTDSGVFQEELTLSSKMPRPPAKPERQTMLALDSEGIPEQHQVSIPSTPRQIIAKSEEVAAATKKKVLLPLKSNNTNTTKTSPLLLVKKTASVPRPNPKKALVAANAWVIQVATLANEANAKLLVQQLRKQGITAYSRKVSTNVNDVAIRVFAGPVVKREKAIALQTQLEKVAHLKGDIIPFEPAN